MMSSTKSILFTVLFFYIASVTGGAQTGHDFILVSGSVNKPLACSIAKHLNMSLLPTQLKRFNDGEISVQFMENLRGKDVYIIQSITKSESGSVNDALMELCLMIDALNRSSAKSVTVVIPYFGYARQDRKTLPRVPISVSAIAIMLEALGVDRVIAVDLHAGQIQGFFHKAPVDNLHASPSFVDYIAKLNLDNLVVVSPDAGGVPRARAFQTALRNSNINSDFAMVIKERAGAGVVVSTTLIGEVAGKNVIIVDDIVDTAGTLTAAAKSLKDAGAKRIFACISHPVLSGPAHERIANSVFEQVIVSDSIPLAQENEKITQVSIAPLLAEVIKRTHYGESVSDLFRDKGLS